MLLIVCMERDGILLPPLLEYKQVRVALSFTSLAMPLYWCVIPNPVSLALSPLLPPSSLCHTFHSASTFVPCLKSSPTDKILQDCWLLTYHISGEPFFYVFHEIGLRNRHLGQKEKE